MAVIHVIGSRGIPATWGGVERQCEELYSRLVNRGHDVYIFARSNYVKKELKEYKGVKIIRLPTVQKKGFEAALHTLLSTIVSLKLKPQIIHYYSQGPCLFSWIPRLIKPKVRVFFTCGGLDWQRKKWNRIESAVIRLGEVCSAKFPHYKIAVSGTLKEYYEKKYGCIVYHIPNGVNIPEETNSDLALLNQFGLSPKKYFVVVSRIVPE
ncbi:MAG: glycosyltransferase, partial [Nitrososphaerota archaeon]